MMFTNTASQRNPAAWVKGLTVNRVFTLFPILLDEDQPDIDSLEWHWDSD